ncbi:MAG: phosphoribosylglycinamide formyltransferase [Thermacetogeniaceae bacterium]
MRDPVSAMWERVNKVHKRLAVLVSGRGTNLQAILDAVKSGSLEMQVVGVFSDQPEPYAFHRARERDIPTVFVNPKDYNGREEYDAVLAREVAAFHPDFVALAGFMRVLTPTFLDAFPERVVNIHPALLPAFPGLDGQRQALEYGVHYSGCTVHFVDAGMDTGPIILQSVVPVYQSDTLETLAERILVKEHLTYPAALQLLAEGRLSLSGRKVVINWEGRIPRQPRDCVLEWLKSKDLIKEVFHGE